MEETKKIYPKEELSEDQYELRDKLTKEGTEIYKESYKCGKAFITVRHILLGKKVYLVKRVNRLCVKIVCINELVKKAHKDQK